MILVLRIWLYFVFVVLMTFIFFGLLTNVFAQESWIIESSMIGQEEKVVSNSMKELFTNLGLKIPNDEHPCMYLETYTRDWCSLHGINSLLAELGPGVDREFFERLKRLDNPCENVATYIGRVCKLENFKKVIKHFAKEKVGGDD